MSEKHGRRENGGGKQSIFSSGPGEGQAKAAKSDGQIVIEEAHMEGVAVGKHRETRSEKPGRAGRDGLEEGEESPKKDEDAKGDGEFFGESEAEEFGEVEEKQVEEDVVPLAGEVEAGGSSLLDELCEPGVVDVAAKVASFDMAVPEARDEENGGDGEDEEEIGEGKIARAGNGRDGWGILLIQVDMCIREGGHFEYSTARLGFGRRGNAGFA